MRQRVDKDRIRKFMEDRGMLDHYNDVEIARKMAIDKSNYSSYVNGRKTITNSFLKRFYDQFGEELQEIKGKTAQRMDEKHHEKSDPVIPDLVEKSRQLERRYKYQLAETFQLLSMEIFRLESKIDKILDERLNKIEALMSLLAAQDSEAFSDPKTSTVRHKKKPGG